MPIRLLHKDHKAYAYIWGWHGKEYLISKYGVKGAYERAAAQARAAHANGFIERRGR